MSFDATLKEILKDLFILSASIILAFVLVYTGAFEAILAWSVRTPYIGSFISGAFFTSLFTVVPATAAIAALSESGIPLLRLALIGGFGAMVADFIMFSILRETIAENVLHAVRRRGSDRAQYFARQGRSRVVGTAIGAFIIASPLPDELGLLLMGLSRASWYVTLLTTYVLNSAGILAVAAIARTL